MRRGLCAMCDQSPSALCLGDQGGKLLALCHWLNTGMLVVRCPIIFVLTVISMWPMICLQHLVRACSEQSRSSSVLPINHVIQMSQCLSGFVNHDFYVTILVVHVRVWCNKAELKYIEMWLNWSRLRSFLEIISYHHTWTLWRICYTIFLINFARMHCIWTVIHQCECIRIVVAWITVLLSQVQNADSSAPSQWCSWWGACGWAVPRGQCWVYNLSSCCLATHV